MLPNLAQMGIGFDFEKFLRTIGELANLPELDNLLVYADPKHLPQTGGGEAPGKPANTNRTYTRVNRPGASQQGKDQILMQALMGGNPQKSEMASLNRASA
jgi:hypothetical protein